MRTKLLILLFLLVASVAYAGMTFTGLIWNKPAVAAGVLDDMVGNDMQFMDATDIYFMN